MTNLIIIAVVAATAAVAGGYIYKEKKAGAKCIGCPHSRSCSSAKSGSCCTPKT